MRRAKRNSWTSWPGSAATADTPSPRSRTELALHARREAFRLRSLVPSRPGRAGGVREVGLEHQVVFADPVDRGLGLLSNQYEP
jgi:hypothetical protein